MLDLFLKGGWVMYAILGASVLALTIIVERLIFFVRIRNDDASLIRRVEKALTSNDAPSALAACETGRGLLRDIIAACLPEWDRGCERMEAVVVGGIGMGALLGLRAAGIKVFRAAEGTVADAVRQVKAAELPEIDENGACAGHGGDHSCHKS